jgi:hypothetical protein
LDLPPRSKTNCGFALSYTSAYEEIRAASVKPHSEYLGAIEAEFFAKTSHKAHIPPSMMSSIFAQLRNVLIEVPTSLAHMMVSEMQLHDALENILMLFYPIFEQLLAAVIIVLKDGADTHSLCHDLTAGGVKNVDLKWLIGRLLGTIRGAAYRNPPSRRPTLTEHHSVRSSGDELLSQLVSVSRYNFPEPDVDIDLAKTARIAIAWDFRPSSDTTITSLAGTRHSLIGADATKKLSKQEATASRTDIYQITSDDQLVGETGLVSSNGWLFNGKAESDALHWPWKRDMPLENCFSDGIGQELKTGRPT